MAGRHKGAPRGGVAGVPWTAGVPAASYLAMTAMGVVMYLVAAGVPFTDVPFRPVVLAVVLVGGLALGVALAQLHASRPAHPGGPGAVGRAVSGTAMVGLSGASLVLARNLNAERAEWMMLGLCGLMTGAAGYRWRRDGRLRHRA